MRKLSQLSEKKRKLYLEEIYSIDFNGFKLQKPMPFYQNGLRFDTEYLEQIDKSVLLLPMEIAAEYADMVCVDLVKRNPEKVIAAIEKHTLSTPFQEVILSTNATGIGNLAYCAMYLGDSDFKQRLEQYLDGLAASWTLMLYEFTGMAKKIGKS